MPRRTVVTIGPTGAFLAPLTGLAAGVATAFSGAALGAAFAATGAALTGMALLVGLEAALAGALAATLIGALGAVFTDALLAVLAGAGVGFFWTDFEMGFTVDLVPAAVLLAVGFDLAFTGGGACLDLGAGTGFLAVGALLLFALIGAFAAAFVFLTGFFAAIADSLTLTNRVEGNV